MNIKRLIIIISIFVAVISCKKDSLNNNLIDDSLISTINGTWKVVSYEDFEKNTLIRKEDTELWSGWNGIDVILTFCDDSIFGRNTTNTVFGNYSLSGRNIHIIRYGGTKMGQPEWGNMFSNIVHTLESYEINEHHLRFYYNNSKNSVTLDHN